MIERAFAISGWICDDAEMLWLAEQGARFAAVAEVGTWLGRSAAALASACKGQVWTVDHFRGSPSERLTNHREATERDLHAEAEANLAPFGNVTILKMDSLAAAGTFRDGSLDMVFLDGDHDLDAVRADLRAWQPKVRHLLCGHDQNWLGVKQALNEEGVQYNLGPGSIWFSDMS